MKVTVNECASNTFRIESKLCFPISKVSLRLIRQPSYLTLPFLNYYSTPTHIYSGVVLKFSRYIVPICVVLCLAIHYILSWQCCVVVRHSQCQCCLLQLTIRNELSFEVFWKNQYNKTTTVHYYYWVTTLINVVYTL